MRTSEETLQELIKLRDKISYQYYEMSEPMKTTDIIKRLDLIIKKIKYHTPSQFVKEGIIK